MAGWIQELSVLLEAEFHARRMVATLCTVDPSGEPRGRMVIVRKLDERDGSVWVATDGRSQKIAQLTAKPIAELVFWANTERQQFRLHGPVRFLRSGTARLEMWRQLSDANRAMYFWPAPDAARNPEDKFAEAIPAGLSMPENFVIVVLRPTEVESLELNEQPHLRRRWREANGWEVERLNP